MVIAEGPSAIFKISIALLKIHKEKLMKLEGFEHVADYIKNQMNDISDEQIVKILHTAADIDLGNVQKSIFNFKIFVSGLIIYNTKNWHLKAI